jgi:signal transduction histidine kinase
VQAERRRLARDLHDSVTQSLHSLAWLADVAVNRLEQGSLNKLGQTLQQINDSARQALKEMRLLLFESILQATTELPLAEALTLRLEGVEQRAGLKTQLEIENPGEWPSEWDDELYAVAVEALNNTLKHARASLIHIFLRGGPAWCELAVQDDGIGFDPLHPRSGGMGLQSMRDRAAALGGSLQIISAAGKGTRVHLSVGEIPPRNSSTSQKARYNR